jgi:hypothetical protein
MPAVAARARSETQRTEAPAAEESGVDPASASENGLGLGNRG